LRRAIGAICIVAALAGCSDPPTGLPDSDLFLVEITAGDAGRSYGPPVNLTEHPGYDNHPAFTADGLALLYASGEEDRIDIYRRDLAGGPAIPVTENATREYAPRQIPDAGGLSVVRAEPDGSQRLWRLDAAGQDPLLLLEWEDPVAAYEWIDRDLVALVVANDPTELKLADSGIGWAEALPIAVGVGHTLRVVPGGNAISFVQERSETESWIVAVDLMMRDERRIVEMLPGSVDFVWLPSGELLTARGPKLFLFGPGTAGAWREVADFSSACLNDISRLAVSPEGDRLVLVATVDCGG